MRKTVRVLALFAALWIVTIAACAFLGMERKPVRPFPHKVHIQDQQMECVACHAKAGTEDKVAMPASLKKCMTCHEGGDEKKPPERKLAALYPGEKPAWSYVTAVGDDVIFSHKSHVEKKVACNECHKGIETNTGVDDALRVTMDGCMDCHAKRGKSNDCAVCHKTIRKDRKPGNHDLSWKETHGPIVRCDLKDRHENQCSLCHTDSQCVQCHRDEPPRNHTNFWRIQGHAVAAGVDRTACTTCHSTDFCDRCHKETSPRSHTATWMTPGNRHCASCHLPLSSEPACTTCHPGARHETAPPKPTTAQHLTATESDCRDCHNVMGVPHIDNGDNCTSCH